MEQFKHLDSKTIELAGISASIAGGCRPALIITLKKPLRSAVPLVRLTRL